jgi:hypothetical protein
MNLPDENAPNIAAGNEVNEVLLAHKGFWENEDTQAMIDEVQDMCAEAFVRGVRFERERGSDLVKTDSEANTSDHKSA